MLETKGSVRAFTSTFFLIFLSAISISDASFAQDITTRISVNSAGVEGDQRSTFPSISIDGHHVVFESQATNLVENDTNGTRDVFLYNRDLGTFKRVNVDSNGNQGSPSTIEFLAVVSADGQYTAYASSATDLVDNDTNNRFDVFRHDDNSGETALVSINTSGSQGNAGSNRPAISGDGRIVAFQSNSTNLVAGDSNGADDIFVRDMDEGTTIRVSVNSDSVEGNGDSTLPGISADGRHIVFISEATNLVDGDTNAANATHDVFVRNRELETTTRVNVNSAGVQSNPSSITSPPSITGNGRYIVFDSRASNLVDDDNNARRDIFVHDTETHNTRRISQSVEGGDGNGESNRAAISVDGRYVTFESTASNLVANDVNNKRDIFVYDRVSDTTRLISDGMWESGGGGDRPAISSHGREIVFSSFSADLVENDTNDEIDIFAWKRNQDDNLDSEQALNRSNWEAPIASTATKAIVLAHGWNSNAEVWADEYARSLCNRFDNFYEAVEVIQPDQPGAIYCEGPDWDVWYVDWREKAGNGWEKTPSFAPSIAWKNGQYVGYALASTLKIKQYEHIHLIGHSAGSRVINAANAALHYNSAVNERPNIHLTFLDPYEPDTNRLQKVNIGGVNYGLSFYGKNADWSDSYVDTEPSIADLFGLEGANLYISKAYSFNVTAADPATNRDVNTAHGWPVKYYRNTLDSSQNSPFGFAYSLASDESGNDGYRLDDLRSNAGEICVILDAQSNSCAPSYSPTSFVPTTRNRVFLTNLIIGASELARLSSNAAFKPWYILFPAQAEQVRYSITGLIEDSISRLDLCENVALAALNPLEQTSCFSVLLTAVSSAANASGLSGSNDVSIPESIEPGPAWAEYSIETGEDTNSVSFVYLSDGSPESILSVWLDGELVAKIDQKFTPTNDPQFVIDLPLSTTLEAGSHTLALRLDSYDASAGSRLQVANISLGNNEPTDDMDNDQVGDTADNCLGIENSTQIDSDGDGYGNRCDADLNNDGAVNFADLGLMRSVFFTADENADLNGDGAVNFADLGLMRAMFFSPPGPSGFFP